MQLLCQSNCLLNQLHSTPSVTVVQGVEINCNSAAEISNHENYSLEYHENSSLEANPSVKRKRDNARNETDSCRKCQTIYGSKTDNAYHSIWINCSYRRCDYWLHGYCMGLVVKDDHEEQLASLFNFYYPTHNPKKVPVPSRKSLYAKKK